MTFRTFSVYLYSFIIMVGGIPFLIFVYFFRLIRLNRLADLITIFVVSLWARGSLYFAGVKYTVEGKENIPKHNNICIVSNHQSYFDIPIILGNLSKVIGFISKKELARIPLLNLWMFVIRCPFINRNDKEKSLEVINKRMEKIAKGQPMLIFPEGSRSKQQAMNSFKKGGLNIIIDSNPTILPITVCNTHKIYEASGQISGTISKLLIHKAFKPLDLNKSKDEIIAHLENIINPFNQLVNGDE